MADNMKMKIWESELLDDSFSKDPKGWLAKRMKAGNMPWLLAHADDGVIWGKLQDDGTLKLSGEVFDDPAIAVKLQAKTLHQVRIFGEEGEVFIWRTAYGFQGRRIIDRETPQPDMMLDEEHLLWGTPNLSELKDGFCIFVEGQQGLRHALPVEDKEPLKDKRAKLRVRHYLDYDDEDQAYISMSRLVELEVTHAPQA